MDRRTFSKLAVATTVMAGAGRAPAASAQVRQIRMIEAGGKSGDSVEDGYIKPFTKKTGIKVVRESPNEFGKLRAIVEGGRTDVVLFEMGAASLEQAKSLNLVEKLDWSKIAAMPIFPEAKDDFGMGYQFYSTLMAWRKGVKAPGSWKDFYDAKALPGKRSLPDDPVFVLPTVLLAAGIPVKGLYPLDVDLAFRQLDAVKKDVSVWWKAGAQPPQLLRDNEVQYAMAYSGRVTGQEGIEYTFNQANLDLSFFCVVKGSSPADVDAAYKLLYEMSVPANQAMAAEVISYTGNSPNLEALLPPAKLGQFPTASANKTVQFFNDAAWWFKNGDEVQKRWQEFILSL